MCKTKKLKVGIVGAGFITNRNHLPVWMTLKKDTEVVAICDKNIESAKKIANKFNIPNWYTDLSEMLNKEQVDIIDNCTPVQLHAPLSIQAMEAGCHVIVEKPMAVNRKEVDGVIEVAKKNNVWLFPIHNTLFNPILKHVREIVSEGRIGEVTGVDITYLKSRESIPQDKNHWIHNLPGGIFGEILAHPIYLLLNFLGEMEVVNVYSSKLLPPEWLKADEIRVTLKGRKKIGRIMISLNSPRDSALMTIYGTKEILDVDLWNLTIIKHKHKNENEYTAISTSKEVIGYSFQYIKSLLLSLVYVIRKESKPGHWILIPNFVNTILGEEKPLVTMEDGRKVAAILEDITDLIEKIK